MVLKPLDNPTGGVGASCSGRNESEREVAPKRNSPGGRARNREGEGSTARRKPVAAGRTGGGVAGQAQGHLPMLSVSADRTGGGAHQPDPAWLGPVLCHRGFEPVLRLRPGLGGEEGAASLDACPGASGLRLGQVE